MSGPADTVFYKETLHFRVVRFIAWGFWVAAGIFAVVYALQVVAGQIGERPAPDWYYLLMMCVMGGAALLMMNFRCLRITMTGGGLKVAYGVFSQYIGWDDIVSCDKDDVSSVRYGGYGIRFTRAHGRWRRVYNTIGTPRVVVTRAGGFFRDFVFSTGNPDRVLSLIRERIDAG